MNTVGLVSPGYMGAGLGRVLRAHGVRVVTTLEGRGERSKQFARDADLEVLDELVDVVAESEIVLSIVPPAAATSTAASIAAVATAVGGTRPVFAELNAVSPMTLQEIHELCQQAGMPLVDGSISGHPPAVHPGTRIHICGPERAAITALPWQPDVEVRELGDQIGRASALKMCSASVYKGLQAVELVALTSAAHYDVLDEVVEELALGVPRNAIPDVPANVAMAAAKSRRFAPELAEVARTHGAAGFGGDLFAEVRSIYEVVAAGDFAGELPEKVADAATDASALVARLLPRQH